MTQKQLIGKIDSLQDRIDELERALRPFAENYWPGDHISMSDVERAKATLGWAA